MRKKKITFAKFHPDRIRLITKNRDRRKLYNDDEFAKMPTWNKFKKLALDASDNGRCWWIYKHIINSQGKH